jgi:hypothetical protein
VFAANTIFDHNVPDGDALKVIKDIRAMEPVPLEKLEEGE